jgi:hypothetical protein
VAALNVIFAAAVLVGLLAWTFSRTDRSRHPVRGADPRPLTAKLHAIAAGVVALTGAFVDKIPRH